MTPRIVWQGRVVLAAAVYLLTRFWSLAFYHLQVQLPVSAHTTLSENNRVHVQAGPPRPRAGSMIAWHKVLAENPSKFQP